MPPPAVDGQKIVDAAYGEIARLCKENHAKLIILVLRDSAETKDRYRLDRIPGAVIVDAHAALVEQLPVATDDEFARAYYHWWGFPPTIVDRHPNSEAHWIIALELAKEIRRIENPQPPSSGPRSPPITTPPRGEAVRDTSPGPRPGGRWRIASGSQRRSSGRSRRVGRVRPGRKEPWR